MLCSWFLGIHSQWRNYPNTQSETDQAKLILELQKDNRNLRAQLACQQQKLLMFQAQSLAGASPMPSTISSILTSQRTRYICLMNQNHPLFFICSSLPLTSITPTTIPTPSILKSEEGVAFDPKRWIINRGGESPILLIDWREKKRDKKHTIEEKFETCCGDKPDWVITGASGRGSTGHSLSEKLRSFFFRLTGFKFGVFLCFYSSILGVHISFIKVYMFRSL